VLLVDAPLSPSGLFDDLGNVSLVIICDLVTASGKQRGMRKPDVSSDKVIPESRTFFTSIYNLMSAHSNYAIIRCQYFSINECLLD